MEPTIGSEDRIFGEVQIAPDYKEVICFIETLKMNLGLYDDYSIECGYEAGCRGYTLYHQLIAAVAKASSKHRIWRDSRVNRIAGQAAGSCPATCPAIPSLPVTHIVFRVQSALSFRSRLQ